MWWGYTRLWDETFPTRLQPESLRMFVTDVVRTFHRDFIFYSYRKCNYVQIRIRPMCEMDDLLVYETCCIKKSRRGEDAPSRDAGWWRTRYSRYHLRSCGLRVGWESIMKKISRFFSIIFGFFCFDSFAHSNGSIVIANQKANKKFRKKKIRKFDRFINRKNYT